MGAQKNRLIENPQHMFSQEVRKLAVNYAFLSGDLLFSTQPVVMAKIWY